MSKSKLYGGSLYALAKEQGVTDEILSEVKSVNELFCAHPDYVKILDSPQIDRDELMQILDQDFFNQVNKYMLNFLKVLCENGMVHKFDECMCEYEKLYNEDNNIKIVKVTTAKPLQEATERKLIEKLEAKTGGRVVLEKKIDESCIGGIIIETDGKRIDQSVKSELENLRETLIN